ncbi:putative RNA-directed DNA polymerase from transposon X-element [Nephila pilipes]|uniref:Putative RNA-directed DNA polymerase from transposon X-element n=1 Tax=Nephila pilipes TaxID=299642 RepID=A0A8X6PBY8_NEPPI|nr:putative RNA-directed DNA polymerase from transposon X-element [Nephila pilipes]
MEITERKMSPKFPLLGGAVGFGIEATCSVTCPESKNNYSSELYTIQEEVRSKFKVLKHEELRIENERYKDLINTWGLLDANYPQQFQLQSRRKKSTPIKTTIAKKQKISDPVETECTNKFTHLLIDEPPEEIEIVDSENEDVTPPSKFFRNRESCIAVVDYNAKHNTWNRGRNNAAGNKTFQFTQINGLELITPNEPTRMPQRSCERPTTIDFGISKELTITAIIVKNELSSDHHSLIFNLNTSNFIQPKNSFYKFINWEKFQNILHSTINGNPIINDIEDLENSAINFTKLLQNTINQSCISKTIPHAPIPMPAPIRMLLQTKNKLRKRWQSTRDPNIKKRS